MISGIHGPRGPGTDRSESVRDFQNFGGPGPVWSRVLKFFSVLVPFGPKFRNFSWSWSGSVPSFGIFLGPGPVPGFEIFLGPGPVRSQISKFFLVPVRAGPRF